MATKRRYKRRTYRKKKRTQKRRVRRGGMGIMSLLGSKYSNTPKDPRIPNQKINSGIEPKQTLNPNKKPTYIANEDPTKVLNTSKCDILKSEVENCNINRNNNYYNDNNCITKDNEYYNCMMQAK